MSRRAVTNAFKSSVEPELEALGFTGRRGHFVRKVGPVTQVIELQHSIYGGRVTANLGLHLDFLKPLVRWIAQPSVGPHAHDSTRWIRIGLACPERSDLWWSFTPEREPECAKAARLLGDALVDYGVPWLDVESDSHIFLEWARHRHERGRSDERPYGSYLDMRILAAVLAWNGLVEDARDLCERARDSWDEERERLIAAREAFQRTRVRRVRMPSVPDIQGELDELISTTMASRPRAKAPLRRRASSRTRRSRSEQL